MFAGGWWKLGTFASGPNEDWIGANAGGDITRVSERVIEDGVYGWYATLLETVVIPYAAEWSYIATAAQLLTALALIVGLWTRPAAICGLLYFLPVFHFGTIRTSPLFTVPIVFVFVANAGRYYGLDAILESRPDAIGRLTRVLNHPLPIAKRWYPGLAAGLSLISVYYLLSILAVDASRVEFIGLEMMIFTALTAGGLLAVWRGGTPTLVAADGLRIFVGYRFLQEIFVRTDPGLPGWAAAETQAAVFESIAATHLSPVGLLIESLVLPAMSAWVVVFAVIQTTTGLALIVGWRTRTMGLLAIGYLFLLTALGFVRLGPLLLASLVIATALGGRHASLDAIAGRESMLSVPTSQIPPATLAPATLVLGVCLIGASLVVIDPSADVNPTGLETLIMLGFIAIAGLVGLLERTRNDPPHTTPRTGETDSISD
ncbi:hypothetical protein B2G88_16250 [Natronolimnobius baerhuensis]|uniref:HTTM domain-containing protein n=1 Tax=Natronolimnobius baerhuensis TaxID=253108 RepID=A0A202E738_9EURY|nr:hypothetical protein B2G88_16250 [Natronolimnobius baerhuensis]